MMDMISFLMGLIKGRKQGEGEVILDSDSYTFTDTNTDGNIVIEEAE